jgi:hypothetical protein
MLLSYGFLLKQ